MWNTWPHWCARSFVWSRHVMSDVEYSVKCSVEQFLTRMCRCRSLRSFIFVFESANVMILETPEYGNATFFFELEQPMPIAAQVLLAVCACLHIKLSFTACKFLRAVCRRDAHGSTRLLHNWKKMSCNSSSPCWQCRVHKCNNLYNPSIRKEGALSESRIATQVQRMITVMGARGVRKHALLDDAVLDEACGDLSQEEVNVLRAAGWSPGTGLRTLLNYSTSPFWPSCWL